MADMLKLQNTDADELAWQLYKSGHCQGLDLESARGEFMQDLRRLRLSKAIRRMKPLP